MTDGGSGTSLERGGWLGRVLVVTLSSTGASTSHRSLIVTVVAVLAIVAVVLGVAAWWSLRRKKFSGGCSQYPLPAVPSHPAPWAWGGSDRGKG